MGRQIAYREALEAFATRLRDLWESRSTPLVEADAEIVIDGHKFVLSKTMTEWFKAARDKGDREAARRLSAYMLSSAYLKDLHRR